MQFVFVVNLSRVLIGLKFLQYLIHLIKNILVGFNSTIPGKLICTCNSSVTCKQLILFCSCSFGRGVSVIITKTPLDIHLRHRGTFPALHVWPVVDPVWLWRTYLSSFIYNSLGTPTISIIIRPNSPQAVRCNDSRQLYELLRR